MRTETKRDDIMTVQFSDCWGIVDYRTGLEAVKNRKEFHIDWTKNIIVVKISDN